MSAIDTAPLRLLIVEDSAEDAELMAAELHRQGIPVTWQRVSSEPDYVAALAQPLDVILSDYHVPSFGGARALELRIDHGLSDIPFIVVSGAITEEIAAECMRHGANDYIIKDRLGRLGPAVLMAVQNMHDRRDRRRAEADLRDSLAQLTIVDRERRHLLARLVTAQEEERQQIAADIHDDAVQVMSAVMLRLERLRRHLGDGEQVAMVDQLQDTVAQAIGRLRTLLFDLRPPSLERHGLVAALRTHLEQLRAEDVFDYRLEADLPVEPCVDTCVLAYRIAQEALINVRKHARAHHVVVTVTGENEGVQVRVSDDGCGFVPRADTEGPSGNIGLASMRERAEMAGGWCRITSQPGAGTTVEFWVPLTATVPRGVHP